MKVGKAKFGGDFVKRKYFKLKDGDNVYRILPPLGDLADAGKWSIHWAVHYGYKNSAGKIRTFQSPLVKNYKTKMIEAPDAALERIEKMKAELVKVKAIVNKTQADKDFEAKLMELVGSQKAIYNLDSNHYVNAIDTQGNIGILKLRHRAKLALDATIATLRKKNIEPLDSDSGRYFVIHRSGNALDTAFQVTVLQKTINVPGIGDVQQDVVHQLNDEMISRLSKEAAQLDKLYPRPTSAEVERIVKEGPKAVDEILDTKTTAASAANDEPTGDEDSASEPTPPSPAAPAAPLPQAAASQPTAPTPAPQAAAPAPKVETLSSPVQTTAEAVNGQSDEDFLKSLGL